MKKMDMLLCVFILSLISCYQVHGQVSCAQLKQDGDLTDGLKTINPEETGDATGNIQVECDMTSNPDNGITVIKNGEVRRLAHGSSYSDAGSWVHTLNYAGYTTEQLKQLIQKSASCEQYIQYEAQHSWIRYYATSPDTYWESRDGEKMFMWGGGKTYNRTCACGIIGNCESSYGRCNADVNDYKLRKDAGYLTDRDRLPVMKIYTGDIDASYEFALISVGPLKCQGFAPPALRSCAEVKAAGFTKTDSYLLDPDGDGGDNPYWAYCDLDYYDDEVVTVVFHDIPYRTQVQGPMPSRPEYYFTYRATDTQMTTLTANSISCQQYFNIDVYYVNFASWEWFSITGESVKNWGGPPELTNACPCALDGSCYSGHCNGFANDGSWREDEGYIFNKEQLPMTKIEIGDVDGDNENSYFRIGPLECKGSPQTTITRGTSCYKVKTEAVTWQQAADACERMNAHLVSIDDNDENVYLTKLTKSVVGPMKTLWSGAQCTPVDSSDSVDCSTTYGYICESTVNEYKRFEMVGNNMSPLVSSIVSSTKATTSGMCSLYCENENCNSFSYNSDTHDCKMSSETTDLNSVSEDGFDLYILKRTYQGCNMLD